MPPWLEYSALFATGLVAGALNTVAGGGSFLTLPLLIFLGLPVAVANGTNRVAILVQNVGAVWGFERHKVMGWRWAPWTALPAAAGALAGTWGALVIADDTFKRVLSLLMVAVSLWTLWDPLGRRRRGAEAVGEGLGESAAGRGAAAGADDPGRARPGAPATERTGGAGASESVGARQGAPSVAALAGPRRWGLAAAFFAVGLYGGFVQAGVGFLILAVTTLAGLDLVRGNALKVLVVLVFTPLSLALFAIDGKVDWLLGAVLAAGHLAGALIGVRLTVLKGHRWVQQVVTATVVVFAVLLWFD
jgi:uncharacterized membrane protein YfcA